MYMRKTEELTRRCGGLNRDLPCCDLDDWSDLEGFGGEFVEDGYFGEWEEERYIERGRQEYREAFFAYMAEFDPERDYC